jgi:hypothetical protein
MHPTGESGKERTSSGVSARCSGTIAFAHSPGDLRQRAHLMQFPIVVVAERGAYRVVAKEFFEGIDGGAGVGVALGEGVEMRSPDPTRTIWQS